MLRGKPHIVVVGAGFGGIKICKLLAKEDVTFFHDLALAAQNAMQADADRAMRVFAGM